MPSIKRTIKYDAERDNDFAEEIKSMPGCQNLDHCIQCGICSGTCPLSIYMDLTPRKVINLTRAGFKEEVLASNTIWLCSSCYSCTVECPREIGITDIMYSLKQRAIRNRVYPKHFAIPVLAEAFYQMVRNHGRITETRLVAGLFLKTQMTRVFGMRRLGLALQRTGRLSLRTEAIRAPHEIAAMFDHLETHGGQRAR